MKLKNILPIALIGLSLSACSDDFLENKPQGPLSDANMNDPEAVDLLVHGAYATFGCMGNPRYGNRKNPAQQRIS